MLPRFVTYQSNQKTFLYYTSTLCKIIVWMRYSNNNIMLIIKIKKLVESCISSQQIDQDWLILNWGWAEKKRIGRYIMIMVIVGLIIGAKDCGAWLLLIHSRSGYGRDIPVAHIGRDSACLMSLSQDSILVCLQIMNILPVPRQRHFQQQRRPSHHDLSLQHRSKASLSEYKASTERFKTHQSPQEKYKTKLQQLQNWSIRWKLSTINQRKSKYQMPVQELRVKRHTNDLITCRISCRRNSICSSKTTRSSTESSRPGAATSQDRNSTSRWPCPRSVTESGRTSPYFCQPSISSGHSSDYPFLTLILPPSIPLENTLPACPKDQPAASSSIESQKHRRIYTPQLQQQHLISLRLVPLSFCKYCYSVRVTTIIVMWLQGYCPSTQMIANMNQLISFPRLLALQLYPGHLMVSSERKLLLCGFAVLQTIGLLQQRTQLLRTVFELSLLVTDQSDEIVAPGLLALPDLLDEVDTCRSDETRLVVQELGLGEGQLQDVLPQVHVLLLEATELRKGRVELVGAVGDDVEVEDMQHIRLSVFDLSGRVLVGAGRHQVLHLGHLVGLLELGSDVQRRNAYQLQLTQRHRRDREVSVDQSHHHEDGLGEHLVLVVQLREPVDQLGAGGLGDSGRFGEVVVDKAAGGFLGEHEVEVVVDVFWDHLGVGLVLLGGRRFGSGDDDAAVTGGDGDLEVIESVVVQQRVVALGADGVVLQQIRQLTTKDSVLHVSVRLYYNIGLPPSAYIQPSRIGRRWEELTKIQLPAKPKQKHPEDGRPPFLPLSFSELSV